MSQYDNEQHLLLLCLLHIQCKKVVIACVVLFNIRKQLRLADETDADEEPDEVEEPVEEVAAGQRAAGQGTAGQLERRRLINRFFK